jgi:hypothetical protein
MNYINLIIKINSCQRAHPINYAIGDLTLLILPHNYICQFRQETEGLFQLTEGNDDLSGEEICRIKKKMIGIMYPILYSIMYSEMKYIVL